MQDHILNITLKKGLPPESISTEILSSISTQSLVFKGDYGNPFLAPRGVFIVNGMLFVSDTGQNRVFIWKTLPTDQYTAPDIVLGQIDHQNTGRNSGHKVDASTLMYPSGIWSDGTKLIVADAWNHRVLIWHEMPLIDGQAADVVIGQPDFFSNLPNIMGIGNTPSAQSLNWPYGVYVHNGTLFIADTGNRRVLGYTHIPTVNNAVADFVIGKSSFDDRDYESNDAIWPYSIKISEAGQLAITDTQYYRVLLWENWEDALSQKAHHIIGQASLEDNGQNQFGLFPKANTLNWCYDSFFYKNGIFVADTGNSRVLWFDVVPDINNASANQLIGKSNFHTGSENADTVFGTEKTMYWPFSISVDPSSNLLVIADTGNHRILFHHLSI